MHSPCLLSVCSICSGKVYNYVDYILQPCNYGKCYTFIPTGTHTDDDFCFGCKIQQLIQKQCDGGSTGAALFKMYDHLSGQFSPTAKAANECFSLALSMIDMLPSYHPGSHRDVQEFLMSLLNFIENKYFPDIHHMSMQQRLVIMLNYLYIPVAM